MSPTIGHTATPPAASSTSHHFPPNHHHSQATASQGYGSRSQSQVAGVYSNSVPLYRPLPQTPPPLPPLMDYLHQKTPDAASAMKSSLRQVANSSSFPHGSFRPLPQPPSSSVPSLSNLRPAFFSSDPRPPFSRISFSPGPSHYSSPHQLVPLDLLRSSSMESNNGRSHQSSPSPYMRMDTASPPSQNQLSIHPGDTSDNQQPISSSHTRHPVNQHHSSAAPETSRKDTSWPNYWADVPTGARKKKAKKPLPRITSNTVKVRFFNTSVRTIPVTDTHI